MSPTLRATAFAAAMSLASAAQGVIIDFDDLLPGATLGAQYAGLGVLFSANAFSGPGSSSSGVDWATTTDMTIVSLSSGTNGEDYGALGSPSLVANNILRRYLNWQNDEDGDPSFAIHLTSPASMVSVDFAGIGGAAAAPDTRLFAYAGSALVGAVAGSLPDPPVGQLRLTVAAPVITRAVVAPGSYYDWVGVDRIEIVPSTVPEPASAALMALGAAALLRAACRWPRREGGRA